MVARIVQISRGVLAKIVAPKDPLVRWLKSAVARFAVARHIYSPFGFVSAICSGLSPAHTRSMETGRPGTEPFSMTTLPVRINELATQCGANAHTHPTIP